MTPAEMERLLDEELSNAFRDLFDEDEPDAFVNSGRVPAAATLSIRDWELEEELNDD